MPLVAPITLIFGHMSAGKTRYRQEVASQLRESGVCINHPTSSVSIFNEDLVNAILAKMKASFNVYLKTSQKTNAYWCLQRENVPDISKFYASTGEKRLVELALHVARGGVCVLDHPEAGLHPNMQVELGQMLVEVSQEHGTQFLVETNSEHLLLRILKIIREGELPPEHIQVIFVSRDLASPVALPVDETGEFTRHWPGGFFDERAEELF